MTVPLPSYELVHRLEAAGTAFMVQWLQGARELAPRAVALECFGEAIAAADRAHPDLDFANTVMGLTAADEGAVEEIVSFYREQCIRPWF